MQQAMATSDALAPGALSIEDLAPELLSKIVECLDPKEFKHVNLVCKNFNVAVRYASISLRPHWSVTNDQLQAICASSVKPTGLDLSRTRYLSGACLVHLQSFSRTLTSLNLSSCSWVNNTTLSHVPALPNLMILDLSGCEKLTELPSELLGSLSSLQRLILKVGF